MFKLPLLPQTILLVTLFESGTKTQFIPFGSLVSQALLICGTTTSLFFILWKKLDHFVM